MLDPAKDDAIELQFAEGKMMIESFRLRKIEKDNIVSLDCRADISLAALRLFTVLNFGFH